MAEGERLRRAQFEFAAHIRDPEHAPAPAGIEDRRMAIYRELFFNNVRDLLGRSFPVLKKLLGEEAWSAMVRDWLVRHRAQTPLFLELPQEFLHYLLEERTPVDEEPPFLAELAHYEWVELALSIDEREPELPGVDTDGDLLEGRPVLSPLAWSLVYAWPVHRISPEFRPTEAPAEPTRLVVYRDRRDRVGFLEINLVTARLLELLGGESLPRPTGRDCLQQIAAELSHPEPDTVVAGGATILAELRARDVLLGTLENPD
jgi:uncharacterized protein